MKPSWKSIHLGSVHDQNKSANKHNSYNVECTLPADEVGGSGAMGKCVSESLLLLVFLLRCLTHVCIAQFVGPVRYVY